MGYGYCPTCGAEGIDRERRPDGNDRCKKGHTYPSRDALPEYRSGQHSLFSDRKVFRLAFGDHSEVMWAWPPQAWAILFEYFTAA